MSHTPWTDPVACQRRSVLAAPLALLGAGCASTPATSPAPAAATAASPSPASPAAAAPRPWVPGQPAYSVIDVQVRDGAGFGAYVAGHTPSIAAVGGRFLVAGARPEMIEGTWQPRTMVIHQWPDADTFLRWYHGADYAPWRARRHAASSANVVLTQGLPGAGSAPSPTTAPAFVVIDIDVRDGAAFGRYVQGHLPSLQAAGGSFLAAGGRIEVIEGDWRPRRLVLHRWPDVEAFKTWYASEAYRPWRELRQSVSTAQVALVAGLSESTKAQRRLP